MTKRIQHVAPLQLGVVLGTLYGTISLIFVPFILLISLAGAGSKSGTGIFAGGMVFIILIPFIYAAIGFIGGVLAGAIYNIVAKWSGGIEFTLADAPQR
jgi:hypothetical protein